MTQSSQPIPPGFSTITPHLIIKETVKAIDFYKQAFGAEELARMPMPDGRIIHASLRIGNSMLMLCDEFPEHDCGNSASPSTLGKSHATMHLYVEDVDKAYQRAVEAGATPKMPPQDMFWGDRYGLVVDHFGQPWSIATHKEDLTPEETKKKLESSCAPSKAAIKA